MAQDPSEVTQPGRIAEASATTAPSPSPTTAEIRSQIEETRAEMGETIDAIQERLSPSRVITHAKETVKEATVGRVKSLTHGVNRQTSRLSAESSLGAQRVLQTVKNNPIPAALIGLAATGILLRALRRSRTDAGAQAWSETERHVSQGNTNTLRTVRKNATFLAAAGASAACWAIWKAQSAKAGFQGQERHDTSPVEATRPVSPVGSQSFERTR